MTLSLTFAEAQDEVLTMFKTAWDTTSIPAYYEGTPDDTASDNDTGYVCVHFRPGYSSQSGFGDGVRKFERRGSLFLELYTPSGKPLSDMLASAKVVADAFEGKHSPGGVWFRSFDIQNIGREGLFYLTTITVRFTFNEVK